MYTGGQAWGDIALSENNQLFADTTTQEASGEASPDQLLKLDQNTGEFNVVGDLKAENILGLGFDDENVLYGTSESGGFYNIDISSGEATLIADISDFSAAGDIVYNPSTDGFLATSTTPNNTTLFSIESDGEAQVIGEIGFENVFGLLFDDGQLFGYTEDGKQLTINPETGAGTFDKRVTGLNSEILGAASPATSSSGGYDFNYASGGANFGGGGFNIP